MPSDRSGPRRLHPLSMVRDLPVRELAGGLIPLLVALGAAGPAAPIVAGLVVLVVLPAWRVAAWRRHTFEVAGDVVVERRGVLTRHERVVELSRVQQVELTRTVLDRVAGTAELRLETAAEAGESELRLRVLGRAEAEWLRDELRGAAGGRATAVGAGAGRPPPLVAVPTAHVVLGAVTGSRLLLVPVLGAALLGLLEDLRLFERATDLISDAVGGLGPVGGVVVVAGAAAATVAIAAAAGVVRDGGFAIVDRDGDLHVTRGVLSTREAVVPRTRLQRVTVRRSWLRRWLGYATVALHSAGTPGGDDRDRRLVVPLVEERSVPEVVTALLGRAPLPALRPHPARGRRRAVARWAWRLGGPAAALAVAAWGWSSVAAGVGAVVLLAAAVPLGLAEHRQLGSGHTPRLVAARHGAVNLTTVVAPRRKVQGTTVRTSPLQRRRSLATLRVHVAGAGGGLRLLDVDARDAERRARRLTRPAARSAPR